jgi:uncharacterized membrane protein YfcA
VDQLLLFVLVGFVAQMIDGLVGMGYGVTATTFLLSFGVAPAIASSTTHAAEVVTTGFSAASHLGFKNVRREIVLRLLVPGVVGAVLGAYVLVTVPGDVMKPWIAAYLLVMGIVIVVKAVRRHRASTTRAKLVPLAFAGGFCDSVGGGGWGPIVVGTLLARGDDPRYTIGSANAAEFFVTLAASITFVITIGLGNWKPIIGLALGGAVAAPIAAWLTSKVPRRPLLGLVGVVVILLSARTIWKALA